jgi:autotransporter translocation and assembly factor TamB
VQGECTGGGDVNGKLAQIDAIFGRANFTSFRLTMGSLNLRGKELMAANLKGKWIELENVILGSEGISIAVNGGFKTDGKLSLTLQGVADGSILPRLVSDVQYAEGGMTFAGQVTGTLGAPLLFGEANVKRGTLRLAALNEPLHDITAKATVGEAGLFLDHLEGEIGGGKLSIAGEYSQSNGHYAPNFHFLVDNVTLYPRQGLSATFSGASTSLKKKSGACSRAISPSPS